MPPPYRKSLVDLSMGKIGMMSQSDPPSLGCLGLSGRNSFKQKTVKLTNSKNSHIHRVRRKDTRNTYWSIEPTIIIYGIGQRYTGSSYWDCRPPDRYLFSVYSWCMLADPSANNRVFRVGQLGGLLLEASRRPRVLPRI